MPQRLIDRGLAQPGAAAGVVVIAVLVVQLVSVFPTSTPLGTVAISGNVLVFTLTSASTGSVDLYWTVSDSAGLTAQCQALASNVPPQDNG